MASDGKYSFEALKMLSEARAKKKEEEEDDQCHSCEAKSEAIKLADILAAVYLDSVVN